MTDLSDNKFNVQVAPADPTNGNVRIYEFGLKLDRDTVTLVGDQIAKSRRLYNELVACMRSVLDELRTYILDKGGPEAKKAHEEVLALNDAFAAARAAKDEEGRKHVAEVRRECWKTLNALLLAVRKAHRTEINERFLSRIGRNSACETYQIRCKAVADGLGWGTANAVLDNALVAFKKTFLTTGKAPRFARGDEKDQDTLTLQFTQKGGIPWETFLSGKHGDLTLLATNGCGRRKYGEFRFRLGSASAGLYASGTWQYHRPLPEGAAIGRARLVRGRIGKDYRWTIQLQVTVPSASRVDDGSKESLASIHFGWNEDISGRRVAGIADSADPNAARLLHLPPDIETNLEYAASIQSDRDTARNGIVTQIKAMDMPPEGLPVTEELKIIRRLPPEHVAISRLHRLCRGLRDIDQLPDWLESWRKQDRLRWQSSAHIARRARNLRRTFYQGIAAELARGYSAIAVESIDLKKAAKIFDEATGDRTELKKKARSGRVVAAVNELGSAIRWAAAREGVAIIDVSGETVSACSICGARSTPDKEDGQRLHCNECGAVLDRKQNGAAVAWQAVFDQYEDLVASYWEKSISAAREAEEKKVGRLAKMVDGRRKTLAARTDDSGSARKSDDEV
ncbi:MAG: hypothetical protein ACYC9L_14170 [Sulfuricaulis sp.]